MSDKPDENIPDPIARRRQRQANRQSGVDSANAPMSHEAMTGQPQAVRIGTVTLDLKAPTIRNLRRVQRRIWQGWPDVLLFAALATPAVGSGIDVDKTAAIWTKSRQAKDPNALDMTAVDVQQRLREVSNSIGLEDPDQPDDGEDDLYLSPVKAIAEVLSLMCDPLPCPEDKLAEWVTDTFTIPNLTDLIRAVWDATGGFPGDMRERFDGRS